MERGESKGETRKCFFNVAMLLIHTAKCGILEDSINLGAFCWRPFKSSLNIAALPQQESGKQGVKAAVTEKGNEP